MSRVASHADGPSTAILAQATEVSRAFGSGAAAVNALISATFSVREGDRIAITGPSGSGKSTLLHILAGLDRPTSGTMEWPALGPRQALRPRLVGVIFQTSSLLAPLTVSENVALPLLLLGEPPNAAAAAAMQAIAALDLDALAEKLPDEISGGQAERVAAARAIVAHPRLVLADEPTGQLDQRAAQHLFDVLLQALDGTMAALVVATHDSAVAARLCARWTIRHGLLETTRVQP